MLQSKWVAEWSEWSNAHDSLLCLAFYLSIRSFCILVSWSEERIQQTYMYMQ